MRFDISYQLTHFTTGDSEEDAFTNLVNIINQRTIVGSGDKIRGGYPCVCFTEAPLDSLSGRFVNPTAYSRYSPFGIIVDKRYLFDLGARPVIYGPSQDFTILPEELRWRYVKYDPTSDPPTDFTWEREWRIQAEELRIGPEMAGVVMPAGEWGRRLVDAQNEEQDWVVQQYSLLFDSTVAEQYREDFRWKIYLMKG